MGKNPSPAYKNTKCGSCDEYIEEGDDVFFYDDEKYCTDCAISEDIVCECGQFKKPEYDLCYECNKENQEKDA